MELNLGKRQFPPLAFQSEGHIGAKWGTFACRFLYSIWILKVKSPAYFARRAKPLSSALLLPGSFMSLWNEVVNQFFDNLGLSFFRHSRNGGSSNVLLFLLFSNWSLLDSLAKIFDDPIFHLLSTCRSPPRTTLLWLQLAIFDVQGNDVISDDSWAKWLQNIMDFWCCFS